MLQKSWIVQSIEDFTPNKPNADAPYIRYDFNKTILNISFYPGWDDVHQQAWSLDEDKLTIGFDTFKIEELSDTSMTIFLENFRRIKFLSEDYLSNQSSYLELVGEYNEKPLYRANNYVTPRYSRGKSFYDEISPNVSDYNIKKATLFQVSFIVNEKGKAENVQIVKGITEGYNKEVIKLILKSSKRWKPAVFQGQAIQTQMLFEIKYLDSLVP